MKMLLAGKILKDIRKVKNHVCYGKIHKLPVYLYLCRGNKKNV